MQRLAVTRRAMLRTALATLGTYAMTARWDTLAALPELALPPGTAEARFDFEAAGLRGLHHGGKGSGPSRT